MENQLFYPNISWTGASKFLLRFTILFFGLQILPILSFVGADIYPWIASTFFSVKDISLEPTGSGDMYYNYIELFTCFLIAILVAFVWSLFNKKDRGYDTLMHYVIVFFRYYVAYSLISYGYAKVFYNQFGAPSLGRLLQPYGESSPMGIAWTFMGASKAYTVFAGVAELIGGILLLFRRTSAIGALIAFVVMFNVMMMNFCYDIPVKLYSTQLAVLSFIILYFKGSNLKHVFITHKTIEAPTFKPLYTKQWLRASRICVKTVIVLYLVVFGFYEQYASVADYGPEAPKAPLYGIYKPVQFIKNSDTLKLFSDSTEWKNLVIEYPGYAAIKQLNDRKVRLICIVDTVTKLIEMREENDTLYKANLRYKMLNDSTLNLKGIYKKDMIDYTLGRVNLKSFQLINRGFHWINEYPYNR